MAKAKQPTVAYITPFGTLRYPKVSEPDTRGEYADGKYKTDVVFDDASYKLVEAAFNAAAKELLPDVSDPASPLKEWKDGDEGSKGALRGIRLKSAYKPAIFDGKNAALPTDIKVGGGTEARIAITFFAYKKGGNTGISARLGKMQVRKLVEYTPQDESPFGEDDGFQFEGDGTDNSGEAKSDFDAL